MTMISGGALAVAMRRDQRLARMRGENTRVGKTGRLEMSLSPTALMNAVNQEGRAVLEPEAAGYWEDQKRMYPWLDPNRNGRRARARPGLVLTRLGRARRTIYVSRADGSFVKIEGWGEG